MPIPTNKLRNVAFSSNFRYEYIHMKGTVTIPLGSTTTIVHSLPYIPYCRVFYQYATSGSVLPASASFASQYQIIFRPKLIVLDIEAYPGIFGTNGQPVTIYYRIYKERTA